MNRSEHQKLIDEIIGEAALVLLQQAGPVNTQALIDQLMRMKEQSSDNHRREAIIAAITDVRASISAGKKRREEQPERDNVLQLFGNKEQSGSNRKH
ncbi:hypothetical protein AC790_11530 [Pantoea sp. RIT-PI-b]|uniref:hypothetical protein n=1 Tax=Pantoea sp. RIT-PI-b TaxID=1681195 RepID=UPI0006764287|nr:hypothetical protein [Pantoea sp. RIT-PI-b]KNC13254.1 hypothetical protein AC790_11530 [Pantoea sp. RIT-PI-b]